MRHKNTLPDREELLRLFSYDEISGELRWRVDKSPRTRKYRAGSLISVRVPSHDGYIHVDFGFHSAYAHCIIWKMVHDDEPEEIDHVNHIKYDNRLCNLRAADRTLNTRNTRTRSDNTSGTPGVTMNGRNWRACVGSVYLGTFKTLEEAVTARERAVAERGL